MAQKIFDVEICETSCLPLQIEAETREEAIEIAKRKYGNDELHFSDKAFVDIVFKVL